MNQIGSKRIRHGIVLVLALVLLSAFGFTLVTGGVKQGTYEQAPLGNALFGSPIATDVPRGPAALCEPFYGIEFVYLDDLGKARELGIEVILTDLRHDDTPAEWLAFLDAAQAQGLRVIPWLWPQGWSWDGTGWQIDAQARSFLQTVAGHPALLAVYALHEPYWNGCAGCGYSTATQQALYNAIKAIADVPLYSEIGSIAGWTAQGSTTTFAEGVCDYCGCWYYPFKDGGIYERDRVIAQLTEDLAVAGERAPNSRVVWLMPTFAYPPDDLRMPSAEEMQDLASLVYATDVAGAWWYPWTFGDLYPDFLSNHPELYPVVRGIYEETVGKAKGACCSSSLQADFDYRPASIFVGHSVWFTSTSSTFCGPLTYAWDWGDGTAPAFVASTPHRYTAEGSYTATLSITDTFGYTDVHAVSNAVTVTPPICLYLPLVIGHGTAHLCLPLAGERQK